MEISKNVLREELELKLKELEQLNDEIMSKYSKLPLG